MTSAGGLGLSGSMGGMIDTSLDRQMFINADHWLETIKMSRYSQHFKEANLVTAQQVRTARPIVEFDIF